MRRILSKAASSDVRSEASVRGFTIVELLIVIVVIAILAAIVFVTYNGITARANASSAQASAEQAGQGLRAYAVTNGGQYPSTIAAAGIKPVGNTTFQYAYNNSTNPTTFCVTATAANVSYYVDSATHTSPTAGACAGMNGLVGWWPLNGNAYDMSGNGNNGVVNGATPTIGQDGQPNGAYFFNGTSNYITIGQSSVLDLSNHDLTVTAWINQNESPSSAWNDIFSSNTRDWSFGIDADSSGTQYPRMTDVNTVDAPNSTTGIQINTRNLVAVTYVASTQTVSYFVNGQSDGGGTWTGISSYLPFTPGTKMIGARNNGGAYFFHGAIEDVRVYDRALSAADIQALFAAGAQ